MTHIATETAPATLPYQHLPEHLREGVANWLERGILPGGFLQAVLSNNLIRAVTRADPVSAQALLHLVRWLILYAPEGAYGSPCVLADWPQFLAEVERQAAQAAWESAQ